MTPEFSRPVRIDTLGSKARSLAIEASPEERAALALRFDLVAIDELRAEMELARRSDEVSAKGRLVAAVVQSCVATEAPVPARIDEPFQILFQPEPAYGAEVEIELSEAECDIVFYEGGMVDVGEAVAETLALTLDPYPRAPEAEEALRAAGVKSEEEAGPFATLASLKDRLKPKP